MRLTYTLQMKFLKVFFTFTYFIFFSILSVLFDVMSDCKMVSTIQNMVIKNPNSI